MDNQFNWQLVIFMTITVLLSSCSTFKEFHFFKDDLKPTSYYYKVSVRGFTLMSSSRYVSGNYDRDAVKAYFGEINLPDKGEFRDRTENPDTLGPNKELVMLRSTNSNAIANSISNLIKNKTVLNSLARLANKDKIEEAKVIDGKQAGKNYLEDLFNNEEHDFIVPFSSQTGGLDTAYTSVVKKQLHNGSTSNEVVIDTIINLLRTDPNGGLFTQDGFVQGIHKRKGTPSPCFVRRR